MNPALTTLFGGDGIVVSPNACLRVTAPLSGLAPDEDSDEQAVSAKPATPVAVRNSRLVHGVIG